MTRSSVLALTALTSLGVAAYLAFGPDGTAAVARGDASDASAPSVDGAAEPRVAPLADALPVVVEVDPTGALVRPDQRAAAGRRRAVEVPFVAAGIRCPDGRCLPLLNGCTDAPPIIRADEHGPVPPVVAIVVDRDGWDWYEHADGSSTTCRPHFVVDQSGARRVQVITLHNASQPADGSIRELPPDVAPPTRQGGAR